MRWVRRRLSTAVDSVPDRALARSPDHLQRGIARLRFEPGSGPAAGEGFVGTGSSAQMILERRLPMLVPPGRANALFPCLRVLVVSFASLFSTACGSGTRPASPRVASSSSLSLPLLGTAGSFAVLAGSTVTNTGPSSLGGDLGVSPGSAITGFPPGNVTGAMHVADAVALQAQSDATAAYLDLAGRKCDVTLTDV